MTIYHIHEKPRQRSRIGSLLEFRYVVCEGPAHEAPGSLSDCHVRDVASTLRGARRAVRRLQRTGEESKFWETPIIEVSEEAADA